MIYGGTHPNQSNATQKLGAALSEARHRVELENGLENLEVPLSTLVSTPSFARFSLQILTNLPRFQHVYNDQRLLYREAHRIRNNAHPVPALGETDGWLETPFWVYRSEAPMRQRLWARLIDDRLLLSDRKGWQAAMEGRLECDLSLEQWLDFRLDGVFLRPRALLTTMYLRLFVADLFLHGIGGGKYDQLTDGIIREFYGFLPPKYAVATATIHLPLPADLPTPLELEQQISHWKSKQWEVRHHGDEYTDQLTNSTSSREQAVLLRKQKQKLLDNIPARGEKWQWHQEMKRVNEALDRLTIPMQQEAQRELERLQLLLRQSKVVHSREFSCCLYPTEMIVESLRELAQSS